MSQNAIPTVPWLAPLWAKMTTHIVQQRFTAAEALAFFEEHAAFVAEEQLLTDVTHAPSFDPLNEPDLYWSLLSPNDRHLFKAYRVPPRTWGRRILLRIADTKVGWNILTLLRRTIHT